jgi:hypothetical protein
LAHEVSVASAPAVLDTGQVTDLLADLGRVVGEVGAIAAAAEADLDAADEQHERLIAAGAGRDSFHDLQRPDRALSHLRWSLARGHAIQARAAHREFVSWWADLATLALISRAQAVPLTIYRVAAANPCTSFDQEHLRRLPGPDEHTRELAQLAVTTGGASDDPFRADTATYLARAGLAVTSRAGQAVIVDDGSADGRRCRIWAELWTDHRVPDLPSPVQIAQLLAKLAVPAETIARATAARDAIQEAVTAHRRITDIEAEDTDDPSADGRVEYEALWRHVDALTDPLTTYAHTLTTTLADHGKC